MKEEIISTFLESSSQPQSILNLSKLFVLNVLDLNGCTSGSVPKIQEMQAFYVSATKDIGKFLKTMCWKYVCEAGLETNVGEAALIHKRFKTENCTQCLSNVAELIHIYMYESG